jgi:hypothetical protein
MYCNHCGAGEQLLKSYCRQCGKWIGSASPGERLNVMIIFNGLSALFALIAALLLFLSAPGKLDMWQVSLAGTFCLIISVYQMLSFFFAVNLKKRLKVGRGKETRELNQAPTVEALPEADTSRFIKVPSVIENTTELLERKR